MIHWLARITFHMNNFLVVQLKDGYLPPGLPTMLVPDLVEEQVQMALTEGYPEIQRQLAHRYQTLTKRSARRQKFDASVCARAIMPGRAHPH